MNFINIIKQYLFIFHSFFSSTSSLFVSVISYGWNNYIIFHIESTSFLSFGLSFIFQFSHTVPHTRGLPLVRAARATWGRKLRRGFFTFAIVRFLYHHLFKGIVGKQGHKGFFLRFFLFGNFPGICFRLVLVVVLKVKIFKVGVSFQFCFGFINLK